MARIAKHNEPRCWYTLTRKRPMPGTPIAKSHSFSSANCFTCRGVISCSASPFRSSGRSGGCSSGSSSPSTRIVGGRPTLRCKSDPLRRIISCSTILKLMPPAGAVPGGAAPESPAVGAGLAMRIDLEQHLAVFHRLRVLREHFLHHAGVLRLDLVHDLHRLDDADDLPLRHAIAHGDV